MVKGIVSYFRSSIEELKKVSWPNREKTLRLTALVLVISLGAALYLGLLDYVLFSLTSKLIRR